MCWRKVHKMNKEEKRQRIWYKALARVKPRDESPRLEGLYSVRPYKIGEKIDFIPDFDNDEDQPIRSAHGKWIVPGFHFFKYKGDAVDWGKLNCPVKHLEIWKVRPAKKEYIGIYSFLHDFIVGSSKQITLLERVDYRQISFKI